MDGNPFERSVPGTIGGQGVANAVAASGGIHMSRSYHVVPDDLGAFPSVDPPLHPFEVKPATARPGIGPRDGGFDLEGPNAPFRVAMTGIGLW